MMCGIAGIYRLDGETVERNEIDLLTDAVAHRGPDGRGVWFNREKNLALGHRRLAILDLTAAGTQPMSYNGRYSMSFNGEIYNFLEIRNELIQKGHSFSTQTDTEVVLAAYAEWGSDVLSRFNGMWAFALYDETDRTLLLSRDRFGVKPLYYFSSRGRLIFSSEVQAIHRILGPTHPLNKAVIEDIVKGRFYNHGTKETYLKNVFSLPGGYNLTVKDNKIKAHEWYSFRQCQFRRVSPNKQNC
jgi:asparagine synthase (glutamine-hydrolysing)